MRILQEGEKLTASFPRRDLPNLADLPKVGRMPIKNLAHLLSVLSVAEPPGAVAGP
ncbi:hypothetical protein IJJ37_03010 [Candidatus Saccharibacteria bacterium]|nr:hypothetical protein [Candidatus Saccharibacteria bacterium]